MKKLLLTISAFYFTISAMAQLDLGISEIKVLQPQVYNNGDEIIQGDTIGQFELTIFNFSSNDVTSSDLPGGAIELSISYNTSTKLIFILLLGNTISANSSIVEKVPENWPPQGQQLLPLFPTTPGNLNVCSRTRVTGDVDDSNNETCLTFTIVDSTKVGLENPTWKPMVNLTLINNNLLIETIKPIPTGELNIYNLAGQLVLNHQMNNNTSQTINVAELISGLYFFEFRNDTGKLFTKKMFVD